MTLRCSASQCVAECCSVLQCVVGVAVRCSALQCIAVCSSVFQCVAVCCSVLQCVAVCCSVLQCVAVCCRGVCTDKHDVTNFGRGNFAVLHNCLYSFDTFDEKALVERLKFGARKGNG